MTQRHNLIKKIVILDVDVDQLIAERKSAGRHMHDTCFKLGTTLCNDKL